jgi:hypothetical protein
MRVAQRNLFGGECRVERDKREGKRERERIAALGSLADTSVSVEEPLV